MAKPARILILAVLGVVIVIVCTIGLLVHRIQVRIYDRYAKTDRNIRLVLDSSAVESLIAKQNSFRLRDEAGVGQYAGTPAVEGEAYEKYIPERIAFLKAM